MVALPRPTIQTEEEQELQSVDLKWAPVVIQEIVEKDYRLEASFYGIEGRQARQHLEKSKWEIVPLCGEEGLATAYNGMRFKGSMLKSPISQFINQHKLMIFIQDHLHIFLI